MTENRRRSDGAILGPQTVPNDYDLRTIESVEGPRMVFELTEQEADDLDAALERASRPLSARAAERMDFGDRNIHNGARTRVWLLLHKFRKARIDRCRT